MNVKEISYKHSRKHLFLSCFYYDEYKVSTKHFTSVVITQSAEHAAAEWE